MEEQEEYAVKTIMERLYKIQKELKAPKGQYNEFAKFKYRSCEDILEAVKPLLEDCILTLSDTLVMIGERYYIKATARIWNTDSEISVTAYAREEENKKGMDASQITGTASSYARKYALNGLFLIDDTKDADTMDNTKQEKKAEKKQPPKEASPAAAITALKGVLGAKMGKMSDEDKVALYTYCTANKTVTVDLLQGIIDNYEEFKDGWERLRSVA